jgi:hypothetical protein
LLTVAVLHAASEEEEEEEEEEVVVVEVFVCVAGVVVGFWF